MDIRDRRAIEIGKYNQAYKQPSYAMGRRRKDHATQMLKETTSRESYLDISCGRGEMLTIAEEIGYKYIEGTEVVFDLVMHNDQVRHALATELPFDDLEIATVSCFDVLEHLLPEDTIKALQEINRVASKQIILTANNMPSMCNGYDLHINKKDYAEWDRLIREHTDGYCQWIQRPTNQISETWVVTKGV